MAGTFEQLVASSSRIVRKQWSSADELAQELFSMLSFSNSAGKKNPLNRIFTPSYPEVVKEPSTSYPKELTRNNLTINFADLKNPTIPNYPELPPLPLKRKLEAIIPTPGDGTVTTPGSGDGNGSTPESVNIKYGVVVKTNMADSSDPAEQRNAGTINATIYDSTGHGKEVKYIKVLNGGSNFYAYSGAETIVFFEKYAIFPVWM